MARNRPTGHGQWNASISSFWEGIKPRLYIACCPAVPCPTLISVSSTLPPSIFERDSSGHGVLHAPASMRSARLVSFLPKRIALPPLGYVEAATFISMFIIYCEHTIVNSFHSGQRLHPCFCLWYFFRALKAMMTPLYFNEAMFLCSYREILRHMMYPEVMLF